MNGIENFIHKLAKWRDSFTPIQYDYQQYDCEIATLFNLYLHDTEALINFASQLYNQAIISKSFSLKHPFKNDVICYATHSFAPKDIRWGKDTPAYVNFIFMVDKENKFPFLILQIHHFFDYILVEDCLISLQSYEDNRGRFNDCYACLSKESISNLMFFKEKPFAFSLEQWRPAHYFLEILPAMYEIHKLQSLTLNIVEKGFFVPKSFTRRTEEKYPIKIRPVICPIKTYQTSEIVRESLEEFNVLVAQEDINDKYNQMRIDSIKLAKLMEIGGENENI